PTRKDEDWKSTDLRALEQRAFVVAAADADRAVAAAAPHRLAEAAVITVSNGLVVAADPLPDGVRLRGLAEATPDGEAGAFARSVSASGRGHHALTDLNTALHPDALLLDVAPGAEVERPVQIVHVASAAGDAPHAAFPRIVVTAGERSRATLVETWVGADDAAETFVDAVVDARVEAAARLDHVVLADEAARAVLVGVHRAVVARDATYSSNVLTFGGARVRNGLYVTLVEPGAHADLLGLYDLEGEQHADNHTVIDHAVAHTTSRERYKGVLDGRSRGAFFGRIVVRPDAQQISSDQENNNLLLSDDALANSTPQLEIHADDVKCRHGSTVGQIEGDALYYLRTRGIPLATARELLTYAFANEIVDAVPVAELRDRLARRLTTVPDAAPPTA
ncbi:MAG: Fe-S cluster assembly protein SufD, partial [Planctomycetota bacterium JB042]